MHLNRRILNLAAVLKVNTIVRDFSFLIKFQYNARSHWFKQRAL